MKLNETPPSPKKERTKIENPDDHASWGGGGQLRLEDPGSKYEYSLAKGKKKGVRLTLSNDPHNTSRHGGDAYESEAF